MKNFYAVFNKNFFFQRLDLKGRFIGGAITHDFNGKRGIKINPDAFQLLDLLDRQFSIGECIEILAEEYGLDKKQLEPVLQETLQPFIQEGVAAFMTTKPTAAKPVLPECLELNEGYQLSEVFIELLSTCNLKCKHCYGAFGPSGTDSLDKKTVLPLLDQLKELQCYDVRFTGGEVFLHQDFLEILAYARKHSLITTVVTNGTLITEEIVPKLKQIGQMYIHVSIDGHTPEIHDAFRGGADGAFDRTLRAVKMLKNAGFDVGINHVIHKGNYKYVRSMWDLADEMKIPIFFGQAYRFGSCLDNADDIYVKPNEYHDLFKEIGHRFPAGGNGKQTKEENGSACDITYIERCDGGKTKLAVRPNGDVTPCITFPHTDKFVMGNIHNTSIKDIFYGFDREKMLGNTNALDLKKCNKCGNIADCKGGCLAIAYAETGTLDQLDPFSCARTRAMTTVKRRIKHA